MNAGWETIMNNVVVEQHPRSCFSGFIPSGNSFGIPRKAICDYQGFFQIPFGSFKGKRIKTYNFHRCSRSKVDKLNFI